jgi:outer membrane protein assembly factor BamA
LGQSLMQNGVVRCLFTGLIVVFFSVAASRADAETPKKKDFFCPEGQEKEKWPKVVGAPIPIVNPTLGWGGGGILMATYRLDEKDKISPPSNTAVFGFGSSTRSWAVGAAQKFYFHEDDYRALLAIGGGEFNTDFYGVGDYTFDDFFFPMSTGGAFGTVNFERHIVDRLYGGVQYAMFWAKNELSAEKLADTNVGEWIRENTDYDVGQARFTSEELASGFGFIVNYDSRDNQFSPTKGILAGLSTLSYLKGFGSDRNFGVFDLEVNGYIPITSPKYLLAVRGYGQYATSNTPVYAQPTIGAGADLRGYQAGRYRDQWLLAVQAEFRINFFWRLYLAAFGGIGTVTGRLSDLDDAPTLGSYGGGLRIQPIKCERLMIRVDYARGNDEGAFYFGINEAF